MKRTIDFLNNLADRLDKWASETQRGGWSTHHVQENLNAANECRREAALLLKESRKPQAGLPSLAQQAFDAHTGKYRP